MAHSSWQTLARHLLTQTPHPSWNLPAGRMFTPELAEQKFPGYRAIHVAAGVICSESLELLRFLIDHCGADVHERCGHETTPFEIACKVGSLDAARFLWARGAAVGNALHYAAASRRECLDLLTFLVHTAQVSVHRTLSPGPDCTPLEWLVIANDKFNPAHARRLIDLGASVQGILPLACFWGRVPAVQWLLQDLRLDPSCPDTVSTAAWGKSPMEILCELETPLFIREKAHIALLLQKFGAQLPTACAPRLIAMLLIERAPKPAFYLLNAFPGTYFAALQLLQSLGPDFEVQHAIDTLVNHGLQLFPSIN